MRIKFIALATCFMILPALAQTTLRGTPDETFTYLSHDEIAKGLMKTWPGKTYSSVFGSDHEYFFVEFVKRLDHGNYVEHHTHWIDQTTILSGEGILTIGGTIADPEKIAPGEVWGHKQVGGKTFHMSVPAISSGFRLSRRIISMPYRARCLITSSTSTGSKPKRMPL